MSERSSAELFGGGLGGLIGFAGFVALGYVTGAYWIWIPAALVLAYVGYRVGNRYDRSRSRREQPPSN